jgi:hypothetical protein
VRNSQSGYNDDLVKGFIDAIWPGFDNDFASGGVFSLGQVLNYGKIFMLNEWGYTGDCTQQTFENFHLFGDPELQIWTDPNEFDVIHPSSIGSGGTQTFVVIVNDKNTHLPVNDAVVCVHKAGDVHEVVYTNPDGEAMFDISPSSPGNMDITVTKHNYIPYFNHIISITGDGTNPLTITLDNDFGPPGITVMVSGGGFQGNEDVEITFPGSPDEIITIGTGSGGSFTNEPITVPGGSTGPVNVKGEGQSGRTAVTLFRRLPDDRPEIFTYCQDDSSTWYLDPNNEKRWDSPCIQLYEANTGNPVSSYDLVSGTPYIINATIYNKGGLPADGVSSDLVTAEHVWRDWGAGGPWNTGLSREVSVPAASGSTYGKGYTEIPWTPMSIGHICIQIELYHNWDADLGNNWGQENTRVEHAKSTTEIKFQVTNPTNNTVVPYIEVRTLDGTIWPSRVSRTVPQEQDPGESKEVTLTIDPPYNDGTQTFIATAYIDGETIGGVEARIIRGNGNQPPETPSIEGPRSGKPRTEYTYSIVADDPEGDKGAYWIEWGVGQEGWTSFHESEQKVKCSHTWSEESKYTIRVKARDIYDGESDWGIFEIDITPRNKALNFNFNLFEWLSERFPNLFPILRYILGFQ